MPFREIVGHRRAIGLLAQSVARQSLPPSLIFAGPSGVGKRLTARALAQALNCLNPQHPAPDTQHAAAIPQHAAPGADACGVCSACTRIARKVHPDVIEIEPDEKGSIKIDVIRAMIERTGYRPFEGKRRVVIIDTADALEPGAQNALLKTLEEPPPSTVLVLVTARPDALLQTVRSRCPQVRFQPLAADDLAAALRAQNMDEQEVRAVAAVAEGSVRRALDAQADEVVEAREVAQRVLAQAAQSGEPRRRMDGSKELIEGTGKSTPAEDRAIVAARLRSIASILRDVELLSLSPGASAGVANADIRPILERLTPAYRGDRGLRTFAAVDRALLALEANVNFKVVADWLVLQL